ncbi:MAG: hypothetical protein NUW37_09700 [Planctomycetes bacterium]|nr:hypothetical protein [Planctomycetota bacterium]
MTERVSIVWFLFVTIFCVCAGCEIRGSDSASTAPSQSASASVGSSGGTLTMGDYRLSIPAGAVSSTRSLSISTTADVANDEKYNPLGLAVELTPEGTSFAKPCALTLPFDESRLLAGQNEGDIVVLRKAHASAQIEELELTGFTTSSVTVNINGFSFYQVVSKARNFRISPAALPPGIAGLPYEVDMSQLGATEPVEYTVTSGSLPPGLEVTPESFTISGTPSAVGSFSFTLSGTEALSLGAIMWNKVPDLPEERIIKPRSASMSFTITIFQREEYNLENGVNPDVKINADNNVAIAYERQGAIYYQRFDAATTAGGGEFKVSPKDEGQRNPRITHGPDGGLLVVWEDVEFPGSRAVRASKIEPDGVITADFEVAPTTSGYLRSPEVVAYDSGYIIAYERVAGLTASGETRGDVELVFVAADGTPEVLPVRVDQTSESPASGDRPALIIGAANVCVVFTDRSTPNVTVTIDPVTGRPVDLVDTSPLVYARVFSTADKAAVTDQIRISADDVSANSPVVVFDGAFFHAAYKGIAEVFLDENNEKYADGATVPEGTPATIDEGLYLCKFDATVSKSIESRVDNDPLATDLRRPSITIDPAGVLTVCWREEIESLRPSFVVRRFSTSHVPEALAVDLGYNVDGYSLASMSGEGVTGYFLALDGLNAYDANLDATAFQGAPVLESLPEYTAATEITIDFPIAFGAATYIVEWSDVSSFATTLGDSGEIASSEATATGLPEDSKVYFRARATNANGVSSANSNVVSTIFDATAPEAAFTAPTAAETLTAGQLFVITWTTTETNKGTVALTFTNSANSEQTVITTLASDSGAFNWSVPASLSGSGTISLVVRDLAQNETTITSDEFTIGQ